MKVLVLGDGLLGSEIVKQTGWSFLSRKKDGFDITRVKDIELFIINKYDVIINCIAYTKTYSDDRESNWNVNYKAVVDLSNHCNKLGIKLVHISTDYIYANSVESASEIDLPIPVNTWYGYTKLLGDSYAQLNLNNLVIRTSHKPYPFPYTHAWSDQLTNGDYVTTIAKYISLLTINRATGVFNVGTDVKTWYGLTVKEFNTQPIGKPNEVPFDITMSLDKLNNFILKCNTQKTKK